MKRIFSTSVPLERHSERPSTSLEDSLSQRCESNGRSRTIRLGVLIFIFSFCIGLTPLNADSKLTLPNSEPNISMDFQDANLKDILKVFSIQSGLNFVASEAVQDRRITLYFDQVSLNEAMDKLFKANNLSYDLDKEANIFIVKDWGKTTVETVTKVFYLKYATVSSSSLKEEMGSQIKTTGSGGGGGGGKWQAEADTGITVAVKKLLSEAGSVIEDFRTNSLIVTDTPSRLAVITQVIAALDVTIPQVMLEVEMLDVSKNTVDKIGLKFGSTSSPSILTMVLTGAKRASSYPFDSTRAYTAERKVTPGSVDFSSATYTVLLDFLKSQSDTKYLARPRILTLSNETAEIKIAAQEMIGTLSITTTGEGTAVTSAQAERVDTGVTLRVTPQINPDTGEITMFIMPTVRDTAASTLNASYRDPEERSTKSTVRIKDGETVIIGGLIRNESSQSITKLPFLGDIPILGSLFRHKNKDKDRERELLVFITPHIVKDANKNIEIAQAKKNTLPEREQNTASGISRESIINSSLKSFEGKRK